MKDFHLGSIASIIINGNDYCSVIGRGEAICIYAEHIYWKTLKCKHLRGLNCTTGIVLSIVRCKRLSILFLLSMHGLYCPNASNMKLKEVKFQNSIWLITDPFQLSFCSFSYAQFFILQ